MCWNGPVDNMNCSSSKKYTKVEVLMFPIKEDIDPLIYNCID